MSDRLSQQREAEIRERDEAATPGPWGTYEYAHGGSLIEIASELSETGIGYTARRGVARLEAEPLDNDPSHREWTEEEDWAQVQADAAFTAHAREDVSALLAELAAVRAERDEALAAVERLKGQCSFLLNQIHKKDARSGEADAALRRFLSGDDEAVTS